MATPVTPNLNQIPELFCGCMVGALLGDCLGRPFEFQSMARAPDKDKIREFIYKLSNRDGKGKINSFIRNLVKRESKDKFLKYTDDTAMTRAVAQSLIENKTFDAKDLAKRFTEDYFQESNRGYGPHVRYVFLGLKKSNYENVLEPAQEQFFGAGSYGNGAAMRVAPVPLFTFNQDLNSTINLAKQTSIITHAHHDGYNGAILLSLAIKKALQISNSNKELNVDQFLDDLISKIDEIENQMEKVYKSKLETMKDILKNDTLTTLDIARKLGNLITAPKSVPIAIYAFLRALKPINDFKTDNGFVRTMYLAISFGGDTDTIACMAGGIAGAYYGINRIPKVLYNQCEGIDYTIRQAKQLAKIV